MNRARGEVAVAIDGRPQRLCLTLGALAEILSGLGCGSLGALAGRLGSLGPGEVRLVLCALLRGGGEDALATRLADEADIAGRIGWPAAANAIADAFETALADG